MAENQERKPLTVMDLVELAKKSQGFTMFLSVAVEDKEKGGIKLDHYMIRQQYIPEDLEKSFEHLKDMISKDLADSGIALIKSAEAIANTKSPLTDKEHKPT